MNYIVKARELGEALAQSPEVQALIAAESAIRNDAEASEAFTQYQEKEQQLMTTQMISKVVPEKEALALVDHKVRLMNKYPLIRNYFQQHQKFERIMAMVNLTITTSIHGMPSAEDLPLPDQLKGMAQKLFDQISGGNPTKQMEVPKDFKMPNISSLPDLKTPGSTD